MSQTFDPEILQDFLTESGELLERLETDLVSLEERPGDPELINQVFRALHTIKGSASFLAMTNLVEIAHAAESALNAARNSLIVVDRPVMDLLLAAVDIVKVQMGQVRAGEPLARPDAGLVETLTRIGTGWQPGGSAGTAPAGVVAPSASASPSAPTPEGALDTPMTLPPEKADLLEFLVADLDETLVKIREQARALGEPESRSTAGAALAELGESFAKSADFFGCASMAGLARALSRAGEAAPGLDRALLAQLGPRLSAAARVLDDQARGVARRVQRDWPGSTLSERLDQISRGVDPGAALPDGADDDAALRADGHASLACAAGPEPVAGRGEPEPQAEPSPAARSAPVKPAERAGDKSEDPGERRGAGAGEQTIRVEVGRLETLMNLVGELVLQKNRATALARRLAGEGALPQELREQIGLSAGGLDRVTGDIQTAVMKTRMQPLDKIFGKYPRLIRDLAHKTGKQIRLVIEGGDTEVDKSVLEELGDPLVHLLRNSADHGVESPEDRRAAGKPAEGTIRIVASHEGSHVQVLLIDDGRGLDPARIGAKAVEKGLVSEQQLAAMSPREVQRLIFAAGFSTAEKVSDLSGRGVGMDVVRTNIERLKGEVDLESTPGRGTTVIIRIPLTIAIMPAMMVGVGLETYAIPLSSIVEIVKPDPSVRSTIRTRPVMRLRDSVLPLVDACDVFALPEERRDESPFAVVVAMNEKRAGLLVSRLIGQQEIVVKPLDGAAGAGGPVSGATVRNDGGVSLIVDVAEMIRLAEGAAGRAA